MYFCCGSGGYFVIDWRKRDFGDFVCRTAPQRTVELVVFALVLIAAALVREDDCRASMGQRQMLRGASKRTSRQTVTALVKFQLESERRESSFDRRTRQAEVEAAAARQRFWFG